MSCLDINSDARCYGLGPRSEKSLLELLCQIYNQSNFQHRSFKRVFLSKILNTWSHVSVIIIYTVKKHLSRELELRVLIIVSIICVYYKICKLLECLVLTQMLEIRYVFGYLCDHALIFPVTCKESQR